MEKHIVTTNLTHIRPVLANVGENIKRYHQLKQMFAEGGEYTILARPATSDNRVIEWFGDYEASVTKLTDFDAAQQVELCKKLKYQVNTLYRSVIAYVKGGDKGYDLAEYQHLCQTLDACIEIPSLRDVYVTDKQTFVLTNWGFILEQFNAETGIIKKLLQTRITDIVLQAVYTNNQYFAPNEPLIVEYSDAFKEYADKSMHVVTDDMGRVKLYDVPFFAAVKVYQKNESGEKINQSAFMVDERPVAESYKIPLTRLAVSMRFKVVDMLTNEPLPNVRIFFDVEGATLTHYSDAQGFIVLGEVSMGLQVRAYQNIDGQTANIHLHTCARGRSEYLIKVKKPVVVVPPVEVAYQPIQMHFQTVSPNEKPIGQVPLDITANGIHQHMATDNNGDAFLENTPVHTPVKVTATYRGRKFEQEFIAQSLETTHKVVLKRPFWTIWWWWGILLLLLLLLLAWWLSQDKPIPIPPPPPVPIVEKAAIKVHVIDSLTRLPIGEATVVVNQTFTQNSDANGDAAFADVPKGAMVVAYISKPNYGDERRELVLNTNENLTVSMLAIDKGGLRGKRGNVSLNLQWTTKDDLDLILKDPNGTEIFYSKNQVIVDTYKAVLDVDANVEDDKATTAPQENIYVENPINGTYSISVLLYKKRSPRARPIKYRIYTTIEGENKQFDAILVTEKDRQYVYEFKIE